ncbi:MAG: hypothetical protein ACYS6K_14200 [Planctomycetota bacterium]
MQGLIYNYGLWCKINAISAGFWNRLLSPGLLPRPKSPAVMTGRVIGK